jgi:hypothetical protein
MSVVKTRFVLLLLVAVLAAACGGGNNTTPTAPSTPAQSIVESFSGTLNPSSAQTYTFNSNNAGDVIVQLTALDPSGTLVGLSVGSSNSFACQSGVSTETATLNSSLAGVTRAAGLLCVHIYDPFTANTPLAGPATYTLQVTHF